MSWVDNQHKLYAARAKQAEYAWDHFTCAATTDEKRKTYLKKRGQGETDPGYEARLSSSPLTPYMANALSKIVGALFAAEDRASVRWNSENGRGWGDPEMPGSLAHRWRYNADGRGNGWGVLAREAANRLLAQGMVWCLAASAVDANGIIYPYVRIIPFDAVPDWLDGANGPTEVKVVSEVSTRTSVMEEEKLEKRYRVYRIDGWATYDEKGNPVAGEGESGTFMPGFQDPGGARCLNIFPVELPTDMPLGFVVAQHANKIWHLTSHRDSLLVSGCGTYMSVPFQGTDEQWVAKVQTIAGGDRILSAPLQGNMTQFSAPDVKPAVEINGVIKTDQEAFDRFAFQTFNDGVKQATATQVSAEMDTGMGAILQVLKTAIDTLENRAAYLFAQIAFATGADATPEVWGAYSIRRSETFSRPDPEAERNREAAFATAQPIGRTARLALLKRAVDFSGVSSSEEEIAEELDASEFKKQVEVLEKLGLPIPPTLQALIVSRIAKVAGLAEDDATLAAIRLEVEAMAVERNTEISAFSDVQRSRTQEPVADPAQQDEQDPAQDPQTV